MTIQEHKIVQLVYEAKEDSDAADQLIHAYLPFIRSEASKFLHRPIHDDQDDELSIALLAFHEAIQRYSKDRGSFIKYASMMIRSRLIDYQRSEKRHEHVVSLSTPVGSDDDSVLGDIVPDKQNHYDLSMIRQATRTEIVELSHQMEDYGISLTDVAENCPRQRRTLDACRRALTFAMEYPDIIEELLRTKRLPILRLAEGAQVDRKTIERHRKYIVALLLIQTNGYEIIRGHLVQVLKGGREK